MYEFARAAIIRYHRVCGYHSRMHSLPVLEAGSPQSRCRQIWTLSLACGWLPRWVLTWSFLFVSLCFQISSSCKDTSQTGLGSFWGTHFNLNYFFKGPISKYCHILRSLGVRISIHEFCGNTIQPTTLLLGACFLPSRWLSASLVIAVYTYHVFSEI